MAETEMIEYLLRRQRKQIIEKSRRVAIIGAATEQYYRSYSNTEKLISYGLEILPVMPGQKSYLGVPCYNTLSEVPGEIDIVQIYPRAGLDMPALAKEAIAKKAKAFWIEEGEAKNDIKEALAAATVYIVEYENLAREYGKHFQPQQVQAAITPPKHTITVGERMHRHPVTVKRRDSLASALLKMREGHFRHLPVVNEEARLLGMLSDRDIRLLYPSLAFVPRDDATEQLKKMTVEQAAVFSPVVILPDRPLEQAAELMLRWEISALPVVAQEDFLVGIITHSDLLAEFIARGERNRTRKPMPTDNEG
jgi:CBS domain-containing protein/predicted CoA-binding protein